MNNLTNELNNRIDVWGKVKVVNPLGATEYVYQKITAIWAGIKVQQTRQNIGDAGTDFTETTHKITIRSIAMPSLDETMYLMYKGKRFDIISIEPNYKLNDRIMISAKLKVE